MRGRRVFSAMVMVLTIVLCMFSGVHADGRSVIDQGSGFKDGMYTFKFSLSGCAECTSVTVTVSLDAVALNPSQGPKGSVMYRDYSGKNCDSVYSSDGQNLTVKITSAKNPSTMKGDAIVEIKAGGNHEEGFSISLTSSSPEATPTPTPLPTPTPTPTPLPTPTPTPAPTATPTPTSTPTPAATSAPTTTPVPTPVPEVITDTTETTEVTEETEPSETTGETTVTPTPTATPTPTEEVTPTPTKKPSPTPTSKPLDDGERDRSNDDPEEEVQEGEIPTKPPTKLGSIIKRDSNDKVSIGSVIWGITKFVLILAVVLIVVRLIVLKVNGTYNEDLLKEFIPRKKKPEDTTPPNAVNGYLQKSNTASVRPMYSNAPSSDTPRNRGVNHKGNSVERSNMADAKDEGPRDQ